MVRGMMFPVSRKQALTSMRMQQLGPEMKKLQEKYKDDKQGMAAAQMELYRKHGVNPFGTCWLLLLQMPIFMGLYYALQESIHFRLAAVLAGVDRRTWRLPTCCCTGANSIPFISTPESYGWFLYLGPYLNMLPIIAVALMIVQQKWTMPPPTDEQQEMQQKMMKYMMVFMGLMFYKVASGLCIYFIASSLWGFCERQLLPKKKPEALPEPSGEDEGAGPLGAGCSTPTTARRSRRGRRRPRRTTRLCASIPASRAARASAASAAGTRRAARPTSAAPGDGSMMQRLRDWWEDILEQAQKK